MPPDSLRPSLSTASEAQRSAPEKSKSFRPSPLRRTLTAPESRTSQTSVRVPSRKSDRRPSLLLSGPAERPPVPNSAARPPMPNSVGTLMAMNGVRAGMLSGNEAIELKRQLAVSSAAVRRQLKRTRFTLDPHGKWLQRWDALLGTALLFTAAITPFEVALLVDGGSALFWTNRTIDLVFLVDLVMQFFIAFQEPPEKGGTWVLDSRRIAHAYATSWLPLDLATAFPIDLVLFALERSQPQGGSAGAPSGSGDVFQLLRMLRILKLARMLRASRVLVGSLRLLRTLSFRSGIV